MRPGKKEFCSKRKEKDGKRAATTRGHGVEGEVLQNAHKFSWLESLKLSEMHLLVCVLCLWGYILCFRKTKSNSLLIFYKKRLVRFF